MAQGGKPHLVSENGITYDWARGLSKKPGLEESPRAPTGVCAGGKERATADCFVAAARRLAMTGGHKDMGFEQARRDGGFPPCPYRMPHTSSATRPKVHRTRGREDFYANYLVTTTQI